MAQGAYFNGRVWDESIRYEGANIYDTETGWSYPYPHLKPVGENTRASHYGTYDQQGNVAEWLEDRRGEMRLAIGGSLIRPIYFSLYGKNEGDYAYKPVSTFGLRVCRDANSANRSTMAEIPQTNILKNKKITLALTDANGGVYVKVGDKGNIGDKINQYKGAVGYEYEIARCELSNAEYCRFLNAVATESDEYRLYDPNMSTGVTGGINRVAIGDKFHYEVKEGWDNRPVSYIGYYELARYANWLHYGCPVGLQIVGVTEGNENTGAYNTVDFEDVRFGRKDVYKTFGFRNEGAKYWIPNENEWYKAAYYDPTILGHRKYHDYPTRTSLPPTTAQANYMAHNELAIGEPYFVCEVDDYENSASYYGTLNQGGNVWEWTESWQYGIIGQRTLRGGSWQYTELGLNAVNEDPGGINDKSYLFGGRLCRAVDDKGWREVKMSTTESLYQWLMTLPKKHLLFGFIVMALLSSIAIIVIVTKLAVSLCRYLKKRNKR